MNGYCKEVCHNDKLRITLYISAVMKKLTFIAISLLMGCCLQAQTKILKEIGEDMSTQIKAITQDNALVGYLAFTRLEKADADSFNYKLTIMTKTLKVIGFEKLKQGELVLQTVPFERTE